jgi:hypothetical protein
VQVSTRWQQIAEKVISISAVATPRRATRSATAKTASSGNLLASLCAWAVFILCTVAQAWCWTGVLTTNNWYHAIENSHWLVSFAALGVASAGLAWKAHRTAGEDKVARRRALFLTCFAGMCAVFVAYMSILDVPMYFAKYAAQIKENARFLTIQEGIFDSMSCKIVDRTYVIMFFST